MSTFGLDARFDAAINRFIPFGRHDMKPVNTLFSKSVEFERTVAGN